MSQNKVAAEPELKDLLNLHEKEISLNFSCHHIGRIEYFNPANQTANVSIVYKKTFYVQNKVGGPYEKQLKDYPILAEIPVVFLGGGGISETFPVKKGDECLVLFNDRDIDNWFNGGINAELSSSRLHSISDGIALVGIRSKTNVIQDFDTSRWVIKDRNPGAGAMIGVGGQKVLIANQITTLNVLLATLITTIENMVTVVSVNTTTGLGFGTVDPATVANLEVVKAQIAGLLE